MKREVNNECNQLFEKLSTYVAIFNFKLLNLCIKAEECSLIPVKVNVEGVDHNLEEVAYTAKKDDYRFWIIPKYDEDLDDICKGVAQVHPEFKQKIETVKGDTVDEKLNKVEKDTVLLELIMPEVNDDRYDALKDGVDFLYEECKTQMEAAYLKSTTLIATLVIGEPLDEIDSLKDTLEKVNDTAKDQRDKLRDAKLKEIEDAYQAWLAKV